MWKRPNPHFLQGRRSLACASDFAALFGAHFRGPCHWIEGVIHAAPPAALLLDFPVRNAGQKTGADYSQAALSSQCNMRVKRITPYAQRIDSDTSGAPPGRGVVMGKRAAFPTQYRERRKIPTTKRQCPRHAGALFAAVNGCPTDQSWRARSATTMPSASA